MGALDVYYVVSICRGTAKANNVSNNDQGDLTEKSEDGKNSNSAEQAQVDFSCDICDFQRNWANGLRIHKHQQLEELDGNVSVFDDLDNDDKYLRTIQYCEKERLELCSRRFWT